MVIHTLQTQEFGVTVAKQEDVEFQFIPLGIAMEAVILRLSTELPRIKVRSPIWREGATGARVAERGDADRSTNSGNQ